MSLYMVKQYKAKLVPEMMEQAIKTIKTRFQKSLAAELDLRRAAFRAVRDGNQRRPERRRTAGFVPDQRYG